jgi:xylan 1,4-beta-xylosidase
MNRFWNIVAQAILALFFAANHAALAAQSPSSDKEFSVTIRIDAAKIGEELRPIWRFFGYDEPNYTYMKDGKKLLSELSGLGRHQVYIRCHNLLTTGDGTPALKWGSTNAYREDAEGRPIYDWTIIDRIFDTYLERGLKPYVQIGFMPKALSIHPEPYQHKWVPKGRESIFTGWAYPPKDYAKWSELVFQWVRHSVEKYGKTEVDKWYWEVWNEPDIPYWKGKPEEYHKLYDFAVAGVKRALPTASVGGPETTGGAGKFLRDFLEHCVRGTNYVTGNKGSPIDFIAFHAKGAPRFVDGHVRMGLANQLNDIDRGFGIVASFPELKDKPIVIGESDPDGCAACPASLYPQNAYRNGTLYASYTAATFARKYELAAKHGINFEGALTWAYEFEDQPYFAGFRVLSTNGLDLPVLNVFRMFGKMRGRRLAVDSSGAARLESLRKNGVRDRPDVHALAALDKQELSVLVWHYHDDDVPGPDASVEFELAGLPSGNRAIALHHYRIDGKHSNAFETWKRLGSPQKPTAQQYADLEKAGKLAEIDARSLQAVDGKITLLVMLPRQAVSFLVFTWTEK